jgi:uncharacterized protein (TIGR03084 family)
MLEGVLDDLTAESAWLDGVVADLSPDEWRVPTPAANWDVATSIGHLAWTDEVATAAASDKARWDRLVLEAVQDPGGFVDREAVAAGAASPPGLLSRWRTARSRLAQALRDVPRGGRLPWFGPPMSPTSMATARYMETWAHGLDVAEALGVAVAPHDRVRHVVHLGVRTRVFANANNGLSVPTTDVRLVLTAPSGEVWELGPADATEQVTGPAWDFALLVTQRRHRDDLALTAVGAEADRWLDIAQAFAGPSGNGRPPRSAEHPRTTP